MVGTGAAGLADLALAPLAISPDWAAMAPALVIGVFALVLFVGAAVFWMNVVLGVEPDGKAVGMFLFFHLTYGVVLGGVLGAGVV